ncbi:TIGR03943 family protein [Paenibacillus sediminis]|uniref:Membrane protein n=1 Tax=Paenibacillus sediminis TaxID=664909 RepID=A0ABS4H0R5_9BACL|nr:TIGR03943 family protein [Paenibacillus sediminis]MBP1936109.1 putative membrane protein [Paenibacillus sediminis]
MIRLYILAGFAFMFLQLHLNGNLNKYINTRYAYLSISAIVLLGILFIFEFLRLYLKERRETDNEHEHMHDNEHHHNVHSHGHDHSHGESSKLKRLLGYVILIFPILTGIFLPVQTLDSSFVNAKGFSFPGIDTSADNPGYHQFLKPDTSVFYGKEGYEQVSHTEMSQFSSRQEINLTDKDYLKGLEAVYNFPNEFMGKTIGFNGFIYKGKQVDEKHYFVFRFGFIHCVADSGVFGMLVEFPKDIDLKDDEWVHVTGTLTSEFYQPFKQTIPVLKVSQWNNIDTPSDPYVYRTF